MILRLALAVLGLISLVGFALYSASATEATTSVVASRTQNERDTTRTQETAVAAAAAAQPDDESVTLTLLHNNDGESKLLPNTDGGFPGIARFASTWIELGRASDADILLRVSAGDNFLASKEFAAGLARSDEPLYDSIALRGLYEAIGLGNHDFDFGPDVTARFITGFTPTGSPEGTAPTMPFLAANIDVSREPALRGLAAAGVIAPSYVYTDPISGLDIGIIGALTPRLPNISSPRNVIVDPDVAGAVNAQVQELTEQGVSRIVLVSHLQGLNEDRALVPQLSGVDIVVAGGGDELLKNEGDTCQPDENAVEGYPMLLADADGIEIPVVTAPGGYRCIGHLEATFDADGLITEVSGSSIGVPLDGQQEDFSLRLVEEPLTAALEELAATVIGSSDVELDGRRASVRTASSNQGELLADALRAASNRAPRFGGSAGEVAIQNGGGIRNDAVIAPGDISQADTFDIAPFANFVVVVDVPRERFKELLEVGVAGLPDAEGTFPQISGFAMEVDPLQPARDVASGGDCGLVGDPGSRVRNVKLNDGPLIVENGQVVPGPDIAVATIDFLARGGDCYPLNDLDATPIGVSYQQALSTFITDDLGGEILASAYPAGGSRITFSTAPEGSESTVGDPDESADQGASDEDTDPGAGETGAGETGAGDAGSGDAGSGDPDATDADADDTNQPTDELPDTGLESWLFVIIALTVAVGGALIALEAQRAGWISLSNRLAATRAWIPSDDPDDT